MKKDLEKKNTKSKSKKTTRKKEDKKVVVKKSTNKNVKKREKKGFTLTELLVIIAIMIAILATAVFGYSTITTKQKNAAYELVKEEIYLATEEYLSVNEYYKDYMEQSGDNTNMYVSVGTLVKYDFLSVVTDPRTGKQLSDDIIMSIDKNGTIQEVPKDELPDNIDDILNGNIVIIDPEEAKMIVEVWEIDSEGKEIKKIAEKIKQNKLPDPIEFENWFNKNNSPNGIKIKFISTRSISVKKEDVVQGNEIVIKEDGIYNYDVNYSGVIVPVSIKIDKTEPKITASNNIVTTGTLPWTNNLAGSSYEYALSDETSGISTIERHYNLAGKTEAEAKSATYKWDGSKYPSSTSKKEDVCTKGDKSCIYKGTYKDWADGYRLLRAKVCDVAGNCSSYSNELTVGLDTAAVTTSLIMKQNPSRVALTSSDNYASLTNYTNNTWYNGWVFTKLNVSDSISGITSVCKDVRSNGNTYDDFASYRNVGTNGTTTITCNAQNKAGTKAEQLVKTIKIDMTVPEVDIIAKVKTSETNLTDASNYASLANYTNNTWSKGYVFVKPVVTSNISDTTITCVDYRYQAGTSERNFSLYRNVNTEGITTIECYATNAAGTKSASIAKIIKLDRTVPACGSNNGTTTWTNQNRTITQNCSDTYSGCNSVVKTFSSDATTAGITITDGAGNMNTCSANVYVDKTAPTCTTPIGQNTTWTKNNISVTQGCSDNLSGCNSIQNQTYTSTASTSSFNGKVITDKAGNQTTCGNYTVNVYVDKTAPNVPTSVVKYDSASGTQRTNTDTSWTNRTLWWGNFNAADTGSGTSYYEWSTGCTGTASGTLSSSYTYSSNVDYKFCIRAVDKVGNASAWTPVANATYIRVDKTAPTCTSSGGSTSWAKSRTLTGTCADTGGSGCKGNVTKTISTDTNSTTVSPGTVYDYAGNYASCPANQTVKVDVTPPTCGNLIGASETWTTANRTITQGCSDATSGCGTVGSKTFTTTTGSTTISGLAIKDNAGNQTTCGTYNNVLVRVDKDAPAVPTSVLRYGSSTGTVRTNANSWTNQTLWWGSFSATDSGSGTSYYQYSTGCTGSSSGTLSSYHQYTGTTNYTFCIRAVDNVGLASSWSSPIYIKVDKTAPSAPTTMNFVFGDWSVYGGSWTNKTVYAGRTSSSPAPTGSSDSHSGVNRYQISSDGTNWYNYSYTTSSSMYVMSTQGTHVRYFRAVDNAGNVSSSLAKYAYIDTTAPTCTSSGGSTSWAKSRTLTGTCADTGGSGCKGNASYTVNWNASSTTVSPGTVYDNAGNSVTCPANQTVKVDVTAPTCGTPTGQSTTWITSGTRRITQGCSDNLSGCASAGYQDYSTDAKTASFSGKVITDYAGNSTTCGSYTVNVYRDTVAPTLSLKSYKSTTLDEVTGYTATSAYTSNTWYSGYANVTATAKDATGNVTLSYTRTPDATLGGSGAQTKTATASAGANATIQANSQAQGISYYSYTATDEAGNKATASYTVKLDRAAPTVTGFAVRSYTTSGNMFGIKAKWGTNSDTLSGIAGGSMTCSDTSDACSNQNGTTSWSASTATAFNTDWSSGTYFKLGSGYSGYRKVRFKFKDNAGNETTSASNVGSAWVFPWVRVYSASTSADTGYRALGDDGKVITTSEGKYANAVGRIIETRSGNKLTVYWEFRFGKQTWIGTGSTADIFKLVLKNSAGTAVKTVTVKDQNTTWGYGGVYRGSFSYTATTTDTYSTYTLAGANHSSYGGHKLGYLKITVE